MSLGHRFAEKLAGAQAGEEWALAELFGDIHPRVLRYLRALEPSEGEDLASDVWLDVARGLTGFRGDDRAFLAWTFTIARRRLVDLRRRRAARPSVPAPIEELMEKASRGDVEDEAMAELSTQAALARIASLPPDQAEVVLLRVLGGLDARAVARIMGKRQGTIRVLQHRALRRLARQVRREVVTG
jgi:RNA polymerase sigma-70 factor, ECF subfamily